MHIYIYIYTYMYTYMHISLYLYIYIYTYTHTHIMTHDTNKTLGASGSKDQVVLRRGLRGPGAFSRRRPAQDRGGGGA